MRNHTTPKYHELSGQQGKNPAFTATAAAQTFEFLLSALPTGVLGSMWYYGTAIWLKVSASVVSGGEGPQVPPDLQWSILQSVQVQCPILGQLFTHANTPGSVLGNIIQYIGMAYNALPKTMQDVESTEVLELYYRIPLSHEYLRKPHETSPWMGFLEGGTIQARVNVATALGSGITVGAGSLRCWVEMLPMPEAVIHTPVHWRLHTTPGGTTKHVITDMGSPDGLQGIDQSKGCGLAGLMMLTDMSLLGGSDGADNILAYDVPWRDQDRVDVPDAPYATLYSQMGNRKQFIETNFANTEDATSFPNTDTGVANNIGLLNDTRAIIFPVVMPARDQETSKFQTVAGAKEINFQYTATPAGQSLWVGHYYPQFDEQFAKSLAARIAPNSAGELVAKTLNKQSGGIRGVGKLAYTRQKVKA